MFGERACGLCLESLSCPNAFPTLTLAHRQWQQHGSLREYLIRCLEHPDIRMGRAMLIAALQEVGGRGAEWQQGREGDGEKGGEGQAQGMPAGHVLCGSLLTGSLIPSSTALPPPHAHTCAQVLQLVHMLSRAGIVLGDLKLDNMLVDAHGETGMTAETSKPVNARRCHMQALD